jgi:hypothetical protein
MKSAAAAVTASLALAVVLTSSCVAPTDPPPQTSQPIIAVAKCGKLPFGFPRCPADPVSFKLCPKQAFLVFADGHETPMPDDYFSGGFKIVSSLGEIPNCSDGSRPIDPPKNLGPTDP